MKLTPSSTRQTAFALLMVLFTIVSMTLVMASILEWLASSTKQTQDNNMYTASEAAAEGATEMAFASMDRDYLYNALNPASSYIGVLPNMTGWPIQFVFSDTNHINNQISINVAAESEQLQQLGAEFPGLEGYPQTVTVTATATPVGQLYDVPATVSQTFNFARVPSFQFAIFYNVDLDMSPGAAMTISGATFCNGNIWCYPGGQMTFDGTVQAVGKYNFDWDTNGDQSSNIASPATTPIFNGGSPISGCTSLNIPIGATDTTNNTATNVEAIINIPPASVAAPQNVAYLESNQVYTYNEASLVVSNWNNGTNKLGGGYTPRGNNFTVWFQDPLVGTSYPHFIQMTNDYYIVTNNASYTTNSPLRTNNLAGLPGFTGLPAFPWSTSTSIKWSSGSTNYGVLYTGFSFLTNVAFYDYRESKTVQAVQLIVSNLDTWITNASVNGGSNWNFRLCSEIGSGINSVYIYNSVPMTSSQLPAVRVVGGARLPNSTNYNVFYSGASANIVTSGLGVATPQPAYVLGNYNVQIDGDAVGTTPGSNNMAHTYPACFLADAITVLSSGWSDSDTSSTSLSSRTAANTILNAACLEGIVLSTGGGDGSNAHYSGGIENFLRMLEDWGDGSDILTYHGSILVMFPSVYATNNWQLPGNYYDFPTRNWGFDTNFVVQGKLPPLTPQFRAVVRNTWSDN